jgi:hypothetical protein
VADLGAGTESEREAGPARTNAQVRVFADVTVRRLEAADGVDRRPLHQQVRRGGPPLAHPLLL